ncbi:hypothetical protein AB1L07_12385 [Niallia alba]|uniref:hypothetical protein n=1 Tax=Niallia alba TaxID=2729105 RepID=UPI001F161BA1
MLFGQDFSMDAPVDQFGVTSKPIPPFLRTFSPTNSIDKIHTQTFSDHHISVHFRHNQSSFTITIIMHIDGYNQLSYNLTIKSSFDG